VLMASVTLREHALLRSASGMCFHRRQLTCGDAAAHMLQWVPRFQAWQLRPWDLRLDMEWGCRNWGWNNCSTGLQRICGPERRFPCLQGSAAAAFCASPAIEERSDAALLSVLGSTAPLVHI
jgi:hypothetical protein